MKILYFIFTLIFCSVSAQKNLPFDSAQVSGAQDLFADDYGNIYIQTKKNFAFTKYDSLGREKGKLMFTLPFKIQSVQNPLNIPSFSENAQELKFFDQNLNEIQTLNLRQKFGFINMAYAEDLQQIWLLDGSSKRLLQYNFRDDRILNSFPFNLDFENILDMIVFENTVYLLTDKFLKVYNLKSEKSVTVPVSDAKRLRRENKTVLVLTKNSVQIFEDTSLQTLFSLENAAIVDKNSRAYFAVSGNKLYLYPLGK